MRISKRLVDEIVAHALEDSPNECCGMIGSQNGQAEHIYRANNAELSPFRYSFEPAEQFRILREIEKAGLDLGGIYHSHTRSAAYPSQTDINLAFYPESLYFIVSLADASAPDLRAFSIRDEKVEEVEIDIL